MKMRPLGWIVAGLALIAVTLILLAAVNDVSPPRMLGMLLGHFANAMPWSLFILAAVIVVGVWPTEVQRAAPERTASQAAWPEARPRVRVTRYAPSPHRSSQ